MISSVLSTFLLKRRLLIELNGLGKTSGNVEQRWQRARRRQSLADVGKHQLTLRNVILPDVTERLLMISSVLSTFLFKKLLLTELRQFCESLNNVEERWKREKTILSVHNAH